MLLKYKWYNLILKRKKWRTKQNSQMVDTDVRIEYLLLFNNKPKQIILLHDVHYTIIFCTQ